uniref:beta-galactoside alpha-(2,6)-sialyltransferase n=1 Tax=Tetraselmis sp. GSL018 TaxID=582737 RepID=A0A061R566_9CHLO
MAMTFKNMTRHRSPSFERTHWLHNKKNPLGLRVSGSKGNFRIWLSRKNFPPADLPDLFNFTTCAVVGSGLKLLKQRRGREIDAHGTIFRSNQAPTKGFEQFVGSRTDIRVTNAANAFFSEDGNRTSCIVPLIPRKNGDDVVRLVHKEIPGPESACRMLPMSPQFEAYRWTTFSNRTGRFMKAKWSSGFSAIAIAVQLCQQVDIYGYSFQGNYYFNKVHSAVQAGPNGERVPIEYRPEFDNRRRLSRQALPPGPDGEAVQRRRLQAMAVNGHSWFNEKKCTKILSAVLPRVQRHKM